MSPTPSSLFLSCRTVLSELSSVRLSKGGKKLNNGSECLVAGMNQDVYVNFKEPYSHVNYELLKNPVVPALRVTNVIHDSSLFYLRKKNRDSSSKN